MVNLINKHGGPVFPLVQNLTDAMVTMVQNSTLPPQEKVAVIEQIGEAAVGMTLRDYYIAHAPAEPQDWFTPKMDYDCPLVPAWQHIQDPDLQAEVRGCCLGDYDPDSAAGIEWFENRATIEAAHENWQKDYRKQRQVQWPAAWADEMLNARLA